MQDARGDDPTLPMNVTALTGSREDLAASPDPADVDLLHRLESALGAQYVVVRRLARGGFSDVFEVCDITLDRRLAVKVLRPDVAWTHGMLARFKQEARALARLAHPHTVPIHFVAESDGIVFYVMPFVEGKTLADLFVAQGALEPAALAGVLLPVLDCLEHAHRLGIVHRDIKPDNILLERDTGRALLVDFGIAKCLDGRAQHTQAGFVVGTPLYMSPEQALGRDTVDARADIYAFGVMLFQLVTGAPPFDGHTSQEIVGKHLTQPVPVPAHLNTRIPRWLSDVILRCMAKDPADRFQSAAEMAAAIRAGLGTLPADTITAARLAAQLEAPPAAVEPLPTRVVAATPEPVPPVGAPATPRTVRAPIRILLAGAGLAAVLLGAFVLARPAREATVVYENRLLHPVWLVVDGGKNHLVGAGDSVLVAWPEGKRLAAEWSLVRPVDADQRPLGAPLAGRFVDDRPAGRLRRAIDVPSVGGRWFAPRIVNESGVPLKVAVRVGGEEMPCDCEVPADGGAVALGYYPLAGAAAVRISDANGRARLYDGLEPRRERASGAVAVRVAARDLPPLRPAAPVTARRPAPVRVAAHKPAPPRDTAHASPPPPATQVAVAPAPEPEAAPPAEAPAPRPKPRASAANPLSSFLPVR